MSASNKRAHYWDGFRDALVYMGMSDSAKAAYQEGFDDGQRAVRRDVVAEPLRGVPSDRRYPVGLTIEEIESFRALLDKAEHAVRSAEMAA